MMMNDLILNLISFYPRDRACTQMTLTIIVNSKRLTVQGRMNPQQPQPLASTSQLISSPSTADGVPKSLENDLRVAGCMMIQEAGIMLNLFV
jgi:hypothetical protein